jgi:hypothetical protein
MNLRAYAFFTVLTAVSATTTHAQGVCPAGSSMDAVGNCIVFAVEAAPSFEPSDQGERRYPDFDRDKFEPEKNEPDRTLDRDPEQGGRTPDIR